MRAEKNQLLKEVQHPFSFDLVGRKLKIAGHIFTTEMCVCVCQLRSTRTRDLPVFILDDGIHDLPHLLREGGGIGGDFLSRRSSPLPLPLPILIFVPSPSSPRGRRGGPGEVQVAVTLPLSGRLFVTHLFLDLLQRALLDRLHGETDRRIRTTASLSRNGEAPLHSREQQLLFCI